MEREGIFSFASSMMVSCDIFLLPEKLLEGRDKITNPLSVRLALGRSSLQAKFDRII